MRKQRSHFLAFAVAGLFRTFRVAVAGDNWPSRKPLNREGLEARVTVIS